MVPLPQYHGMRRPSNVVRGDVERGFVTAFARPVRRWKKEGMPSPPSPQGRARQGRSARQRVAITLPHAGHVRDGLLAPGE